MTFQHFGLNSVPVLTVTARGTSDIINGTILQFGGHFLDPHNKHQIAAYFVLSLTPKGSVMPVSIIF